ncbi:aminotransferase class I/II-fold pyridoxal phosphate-dependent enzyme [Rothia halotolerans]|uniref:aminotransferase class I/II-fold pyridoxal phosphate-dependent enzyme n=1 Tax=Rothia halotolerans TaxID=405770 RepID=UPI00101BE2FE|nr:aminotransferase class I/II-fold pyridoxal phosphate-dependent enzyme [Rothia halotolerans]
MTDILLESPIADDFAGWQAEGVSPFFPTVGSHAGNRVRMNSRDGVLMFGSCDYLGLSQHPAVAEASIRAIRQFGTNTYGAQALCGRTVLHEGVEEHLARLHAKDAALLFPSGMSANLAVLTSLAGPEDTVINDRLNHISIFMGARLSGAKIRTYQHNDMRRLEAILSSSTDKRRRIIVTDGLFSADGDLAPLDEIIVLAQRYDAMVVVDEAHSFGCLGPRGLGAADHHGALDKVDVIVGTMSKAVGSTGGFVVTNNQIHLALRTTAPSYTSSRGASPAVAGAALKALEIIEHDGLALRTRLGENVEYISSGLRSEGIDLANTSSQILPVMIGSEDTTIRVAHRLIEYGVFTAAFTFPNVPKGQARLRVGVTATHTPAECDELIDKLLLVRKEYPF